jgi:hypothetical protein
MDSIGGDVEPNVEKFPLTRPPELRKSLNSSLGDKTATGLG